MSLAELLPTIQALPRADKLRLTHFLVEELAHEEGAPLCEPGRTFEIWSPYDSFDAARQLAELLEQSRKGE